MRTRYSGWSSPDGLLPARALTLAAIAALAPSGAAGCGDDAEVRSATLSVGDLEVRDDGRTIVLRRGDEAVLTLGEDAFQIGTSADDLGAGSFDPWAIEQRGEADTGVTFLSPTSFRASTEGPRAVRLELGYPGGVTATARIEWVQDARFSIDLSPSGPGVALARVRARTSGDPREGFYGLGEQEDSVDQRGKLRAMQIEPDGTLESGYNEAHVPVPLLLGTRGWGLFVASRRTGAFDVARKDPAVVEATFAVAPAPGDDGHLHVWLFAEPTPLELLRDYYAIAGAPRLPPPWALGPWIWRNENKDQAEVLDDIATLRDLDLATSGIWIDRPYATAVNTFDFDPTKFSDPATMIARAHGAGLRFALWSAPYVEEAAGSLHAQAVGGGFFPPQTGLLLNKWSAPIDFTNPNASAFWEDLVRRYTTLGVDGFKLDYAEDVVPALGTTRNVWRFADGTDERTMHHGYSALYHGAYGRPLGDQGFLLCRAAHWGEQASGCVIWPGDMDATFTRHGETFTDRDGKAVPGGVGGLPATIVMGSTLSVSGFAFFGADTGGYRHAPPDAELWSRWVEQTALSTVMQVGDASSQPPWVFTADNGRDASSVDLYRTYARLHTRLFPYEWTHAARLATTGRPIVRPLGLAYPDLGAHPDDVYLVGDARLVAPVVTRGERSRRVELPPGAWIDWWDGASYAGSASIDAPLEKLPLLLREGALVPMLRPTIDTLADATDLDVDSFARDPGALWIRATPGPARDFTLWDGTSIARDPAGVLVLRAGSVFARGFVLEQIATPEPAGVDRDGVPLPRLAGLDAPGDGFTWEPAAHGTLRVKLAAGGAVSVR